MLSRQQFEEGAKAFARRHPQWRWSSNSLPGYGYLDRTTSHFPKTHLDLGQSDLIEEDLEEEKDLAAAVATKSCYTIQEYIVYSASFMVPAFYFTIHGSNGTALSLNDLVNTTLFKAKLPDRSEVTPFAVSVPSTPFPLLSQGDHPTLGIPCWYFHPCETSKAVEEFTIEEKDDGLSEEDKCARWLEIWLMIVGSVLNV